MGFVNRPSGVARTPHRPSCPHPLRVLQESSDTQQSRASDRAWFLQLIRGGGLATPPFLATHARPLPAAATRARQAIRPPGRRPAPQPAAAVSYPCACASHNHCLDAARLATRCWEWDCALTLRPAAGAGRPCFRHTGLGAPREPPLPFYPGHYAHTLVPTACAPSAAARPAPALPEAAAAGVARLLVLVDSPFVVAGLLRFATTCPQAGVRIWCARRDHERLIWKGSHLPALSRLFQPVQGLWRAPRGRAGRRPRLAARRAPGGRAWLARRPPRRSRRGPWRAAARGRPHAYALCCDLTNLGSAVSRVPSLRWAGSGCTWASRAL